MKRNLYDLALSVKYISFTQDVSSTSISFGKRYLHRMFLGEGKVNGSLVIKRKAQQPFVIDSSITYSKFRYFMRLYSKYNALYFVLHHNMDMLQETCNITRFIVIFRIWFESNAFIMKSGTCTVTLFSLSKYEY